MIKQEKLAPQLPPTNVINSDPIVIDDESDDADRNSGSDDDDIYANSDDEFTHRPESNTHTEHDKSGIHNENPNAMSSTAISPATRSESLALKVAECSERRENGNNEVRNCASHVDTN